MMTFGLMRPVYSFGLAVAGSIFLFGGMCGYTPEDVRQFVGEDARFLTVTDIDRILETGADHRIIEILEQRDLYTLREFRTFKPIEPRFWAADDSRIFIAEDTRTFIVERPCKDVDV